MMVFLAWDSCMTILHGKVVVQAALCGIRFLSCMETGQSQIPHSVMPPLGSLKLMMNVIEKQSLGNMILDCQLVL